MNSTGDCRLRRVAAGALVAFAVLVSGAAFGDPPARVARLALVNGAVSISPAGEDEWALAQTNRPLVTGDRIWADAGSRAELQIGSAAIRLGASTSATILNLDDRFAQFQLAQGTINLRVHRLYGDQVYEVDTPNLAFSIRRAGEYRIDVEPAGSATTISVLSGEGEAYGEGTAYLIGERQRYRFAGASLRDYQFQALAPPDEFDRWSFDRDRREDNPVSARYVSPEVIGYSDLDDYGTWSPLEGYGNVWIPTRIDPGWAPYRYGHWAWIDPWGWTWVDDAPWGFAPFHYGRWAFARQQWCWVPGPPTVRPVYAPALVAFVGGGDFRLSIASGGVAGIAWFPLGPGEVYRPAYPVSRNYFTNVNISNTTINNTYVTNVYNNPQATKVVYRNQQAPGSITAVPTTAFAGGHSVARAAVPVSREVIATAPVTTVAAVAPTRASIMTGASGAATGSAAATRPPASTLARPVVARMAPPPPPTPFAARERLLAAHPGKPIEPAAAASLRTAAPVAAPNVRLVAPSRPPVALPGAEPGMPARALSSPGAAQGSATPTGRPATGGNMPQPRDAQSGLPAQSGMSRPPEVGKVPTQTTLAKPPAGPNATPEMSRGQPPSVARPPEAQKGPAQEAFRSPSPQVNAPRTPEVRKAPPSDISGGQPPAINAPRPSEPQRAAPAEVSRGAQSQANVPRPPDAQRAAPQESFRGPPPAPRAPAVAEVPKPPPPQLRTPQPPPQASAPKPPEAQKPPAPRREEGKPKVDEKKDEAR